MKKFHKILVAMFVFTVALQVFPKNVDCPINLEIFKKPPVRYYDRLLYMPEETDVTIINL